MFVVPFQRMDFYGTEQNAIPYNKNIVVETFCSPILVGHNVR